MKRLIPAIALCLVPLAASAASASDEASAFFDDSEVREIRLYFSDSDWYNQLYQAHANDREDPYFEARMEYGDIVLEPICDVENMLYGIALDGLPCWSAG